MALNNSSWMERTPPLAEISIRELLSCLTTSDDTDDIRALDVAGQPAIMRSAVGGMVEAGSARPRQAGL